VRTPIMTYVIAINNMALFPSSRVCYKHYLRSFYKCSPLFM